MGRLFCKTIYQPWDNVFEVSWTSTVILKALEIHVFFCANSTFTSSVCEKMQAVTSSDILEIS